ncbi:MAG: HEAT repeat domain-containing protein [Deltaproteobacteria bacterium]|nr:HEAT repeat domain-containing protein [Deltaproteobacteria bacterium]
MIARQDHVMVRGWLALALAVALSAAAAPAVAAGLVASPQDLEPAARAALASSIQAERAAHPEAFSTLGRVDGHLPSGYGKLRNPSPKLVGLELRRLGWPALLPMLDALAFQAPARRGATDAEQRALAVGMLDAVGRLRDARSRPVLESALRQRDDEVVRAAALALGRLCDTGSFELLRSAARGSDLARDPRRLAAVAGLGECRRLGSARVLGAMMGATRDPVAAQALAEALGSVGSSWAWRAKGPKAEAESLAVRRLAAEALVRAFIGQDGGARQALGRALVLVEHPATPDLLREARARADAQTGREIDRLLGRLEGKRR